MWGPFRSGERRPTNCEHYSFYNTCLLAFQPNTYGLFPQIPITIRTSTIQCEHYHSRCVMLVPGHLIRCRTTLSRTSRLRRILPDSDPPTTPQTSLWPTSETQPHTAFLRRRKTYQKKYNTDTMGMDIIIHARILNSWSKNKSLYFPTISDNFPIRPFLSITQNKLTSSGVSPQKGCESRSS